MSTTGAIDANGPSRLWLWVRAQTQSLSVLLDLILVAAGACYGVGYLVWSVNAWNRNLGLLPALRFQYLIAGAIPILFVLALYGFLWGLFRLRHLIASWVNTQRGFRWLVRRGLLSLAVASLVVFFITGLDWVEALNVAWLESVQKGSLITLYVSGFLLPPPAQRAAFRNTPRWRRFVNETAYWNIVRWTSVGYVVLAAFLGALVGLAWFTLEAYPRIPPELGGVQPRRAVVYLSTESRLAPEILATLRGTEGDEHDGGGPPLHAVEGVATGSDETEQEGPVPREEGVLELPPTEESGDAQPATMVEVDVYFADGNMLLVKPVGEDQPSRSPTYEIRRQSVAAISWQ